MFLERFPTARKLGFWSFIACLFFLIVGNIALFFASDWGYGGIVILPLLGPAGLVFTEIDDSPLLLYTFNFLVLFVPLFLIGLFIDHYKNERLESIENSPDEGSIFLGIIFPLLFIIPFSFDILGLLFIIGLDEMPRWVAHFVMPLLISSIFFFLSKKKNTRKGILWVLVLSFIWGAIVTVL